MIANGKNILPLLCLVALLLFNGCSEKIVNNSDTASVEISVNAGLSSINNIEQIDGFRLIITGPGIDKPIIVPLQFIDGFLRGVAIVPIGRDRIFIAQAIDAAGIIVYSGKTIADVQPDRLNKIDIRLYPQVPMVKISPRFLSAPQGSEIALDIKVYGISNLMSIDVVIGFDDTLVTPSYAAPNTDVNSYITLEYLIPPGSNYYAFRIFESFHTEQYGIVDDSGYAKIGTVHFYAYSSDVVFDTVDFSIDIAAMHDVDQMPIPISGVYLAGNTVELYQASYYMIAFWPMDFDTFPTVFDASGNLLDGVAYGPIYGTGSMGMAWFFDGFDDYIEVPDDDRLDLTEEITITLWVLFNDSEYDAVLLSKREPDGGINYQIEYISSPISGDATLSFRYGPSPGNAYQISTYLGDALWHEIVISCKFGDPHSMAWVVDGQIIEGIWNAADMTSEAVPNDYNLQFGRQVSSTDSRNFKGGLDNITIFNKAIDAHYFLWR
jgi:hypothetical protein